MSKASVKPKQASGTAAHQPAKSPTTSQYLFKNFEMLDPEQDELRGGHELLVEGELIREVSDRPIKAPDATVIDCGGRTLMPGLIDEPRHACCPKSPSRASRTFPHLMTARGRAHARHARPRLHQRARHRRRRLGPQGGDRQMAAAGAQAVHAARRWGPRAGRATAAAAPTTARAVTAATRGISHGARDGVAEVRAVRGCAKAPTR
jgi:cytosine/adenosine deaminase-related metal-dependent hydrolase